MAKFVVKSRRITIEGELYTCSISQGMEGMELLVYQNKGPFFRLRQNWAEAWGIDLYRPGVMVLLCGGSKRKRTVLTDLRADARGVGIMKTKGE